MYDRLVENLVLIFQVDSVTFHEGSAAAVQLVPQGSVEVALLLALGALRERGASALVVYSDSSILVGQLSGTPVAPIARLQDLFDEARTQLQSFAAVSLQWIPRHRNAEADALARAALGCARSASAPQRPRARQVRLRCVRMHRLLRRGGQTEYAKEAAPAQ